MNVLLNSDSLFILGFIGVAVLGLAFGSFASALIHRIPQGQSAWNIKARSACPNCDKTLQAKDLVPLLSWLFSKGRCQYCSAVIPKFYPLLEMFGCVMALTIFYFYQDNFWAERLIITFTVPFLLALIVIDLRHKILPNSLVMILAVIGVCRLASVLWFDVEAGRLMAFESGLGLFIYGVLAWILAFVMEKALKKPAMGMGDIKFFAVAGLWLGIANLGMFCIFAGVFGVILGLFWRKIHKDEAFPFGPALIASFFILLCLESSLL